MRPFLCLVALVQLVFVQADNWPFDVTTFPAPDGSIPAKFVTLGATMTELWVKDKNNTLRDIVLSYGDNNGSFSIPISKDPRATGPNVYHIALNDHDGSVHAAHHLQKSQQQSLTGGIIGWDRRNWTVVEKTSASVVYSHFDPAEEGFPGNVTVYTPIMVTQYIYWNLDAFQDGSTDIPTGEFFGVEDTAYDFTNGPKLGSLWNISDTIDNCFIYSHKGTSQTALWSDLSGIRLDISTNQPAVQVFAASFFDLVNIPRKVVHGGPDAFYKAWSVVAIEQEGYVSAINIPEWHVDQIYYPGRDYDWNTTYSVSLVKV
ncbi:galactose mutarotase-like protein [Mycena floridula]|nr:galactose mutarotase-like protein [Mycena floridula]